MRQWSEGWAGKIFREFSADLGFGVWVLGGGVDPPRRGCECGGFHIKNTNGWVLAREIIPLWGSSPSELSSGSHVRENGVIGRDRGRDVN